MENINDGNDGVRKYKYADDYHIKVGNNFHHICEFDEFMERNGNKDDCIREDES